MKNRLLFTLISFLLMLSSGYAKKEKFKTFELETKGIKIEINTKLELFHIMAYLSNANYMNSFDSKYKSDINTFFASYKNENSVQFIKKILENYHAHLSINGLFFDANFNKDTSYLKFLELDSFGLANTIINKSIILDSLNHTLASFAKLSRFDKFVKNHSGYYLHKIEEVAKEVSGQAMIKDFERFWGLKKDNYTIIITMLEQDIHAYWYANNNTSNCVFFLSPKFIVDNDAKFGNSEITNLKEGKMAAKDYIYYGATHEMGHAFLNPMLANFNEQIEQIPFKYSTPDPSKISFLCESFLRSLTAYFLIKNQYNEFAQMVIQGEKQQGYMYNDLIVDLISDYANKRNNFNTFNDYIPVFLENLKEKLENK